MRARRYGAANASTVASTDRRRCRASARWSAPHAADDEQRERDQREHDRRSRGRARASRAAPSTPSITSTGGHWRQSWRRSRAAGEHARRRSTSSASFAISLGCTRERADAEPAPRAVDEMPTPGTSTTHERDERDDEQPRARARRQHVVVERRRDDERDEPDERPHELAVEEVPRRAVVAERRDRRRREDHHEADDVEHRDRRAEDDVGRRARQRALAASTTAAPAPGDRATGASNRGDADGAG